MAYNEAMKCLSKNTQNDERIHGELLLLNELLRVSNIEFEVRNRLVWNFSIFNIFRIFIKI